MTKSDRNGLEIRLYELKRLSRENDLNQQCARTRNAPTESIQALAQDKLSIERNIAHVEESLDDLEQYAPSPRPIGVAWLLAIAVICLFWLWAIS